VGPLAAHPAASILLWAEITLTLASPDFYSRVESYSRVDFFILLPGKSHSRVEFSFYSRVRFFISAPCKAYYFFNMR
jgi:hypothetical protein